MIPSTHLYLTYIRICVVLCVLALTGGAAGGKQVSSVSACCTRTVQERHRTDSVGRRCVSLRLIPCSAFLLLQLALQTRVVQTVTNEKTVNSCMLYTSVLNYNNNCSTTAAAVFTHLNHYVRYDLLTYRGHTYYTTYIQQLVCLSYILSCIIVIIMYIY